MMKREIFKVEGGKIVRLRRNCPKCGDGVFLAEHKDRLSCGTCGYTEFKGKKPPVVEKPSTPEEKTAEKETPLPEEPKQDEQTTPSEEPPKEEQKSEESEQKPEESQQ